MEGDEVFQMIHQRCFIHSFNRAVTDKRFCYPVCTINEFIAIPALITKEIAIHIAVIPVHNTTQLAVPLPGYYIASQAAVMTNRRSSGEIPFAGIMFFKRFIGKYTRGAYFGQVTAERALQYPVFFSSKINMVMRPEHIQIIASCIIAVKPYTTVALYAPVHFMVDKRPQVLIGIGPLFKFKTPVIMPGHYRHILQMTTATFIANRTIVGMIGHQPFNNLLSESPGCTIGNGHT